MKRKLFAIITAAAVLLSLVPSFPIMAEVAPAELGTGGLVLDTDPQGGYEGDYVLIYNPTEGNTSLSTGDMTGRIETSIDPYASVLRESTVNDELYRIDVDGMIAEKNEKSEKPEPPSGMRTSYNVGDTRSFDISSYSPGPSTLTFKCVAKGDHCYVWTPAQNLTNYYTLDSIDPTYPQLACDEFESKFEQMRSSFGDHSNGSEGDGRINLMYYNIDDGFVVGSSTGYVAGYFSSMDYYYNGLPMIHIDTYPCVYYVNTAGEEIYRMSNSYSVFCHEYQHLINYSITGGMTTWLNEAMSAAAEEICYPGSSVVSRIQSWENYYYSENNDWLTPPHEFEYTPAYELHNGYSMYNWSNSLNYILPLYSQVSLFSQYLFTHYGNSIFRSITAAYGSSDAFGAISSATGMNTSDLVKNFRIALTANDYYSEGGLYGFAPQSGYDPEEYHGLENPYQILGPVVYTGNSCSIAGGGAITVKPIGGSYTPPSGAGSNLVYIGITRNISSETIPLEGISIYPGVSEVYTGKMTSFRIVSEPVNANDFDVTWSVSDPSAAQLTPSGRSVYVTGLTEGSVEITALAVDRSTGDSFTASARLTVIRTPTLDDALNVTGGTLSFTTSAPYPWEVNTDISGRACANSTNINESDSSSSIETVIEMQAGETLTFEWSVSSEQNYDKLFFYVNSNPISNISGEVGFTQVTYTAANTGTYTFKWTYTKDYSLNRGQDRGYLDNVEYSGDPGLEILLGDVNMNGTIESSDALLALRYALGIMDLSEEQLLRADVSQDGEVRSEDALIILRMALGII